MVFAWLLDAATDLHISYMVFFCAENVQMAVNIESMFEIVICDIGNKQCKELNFCGVVEV